MNIPKWAEALIIKAIKDFLPASAIAEMFESFKVELFAKLRELAKQSTNEIDDMLVDKLEEALKSCDIDNNMLCELIEKGEDGIVSFLRAMAAKSETKIDDALVDILEKALKS
jgi:signal recognition particle GTPase